MMSKFAYLASPYSGEKPLMVERFHAVKLAVSVLLSRRLWVYSPILHCHQMAEDHSLPTDFAFWLEYNHRMIDAAGAVWVLGIPGWRESKGVAEEITYARKLGCELKFVDPVQHGVYAFEGYTEETCPGHIASTHDAKRCAHCGTHIDSLR